MIGLAAVSLAVVALAYGFLAPPQIRFASHAIFQAVGQQSYYTNLYTDTVYVGFGQPVFPYPRRITSVSIPDSPLKVAWSELRASRGPWVNRGGFSLHITAPGPGVYEFTRLRVTFGRTSRTYDIGKVVLDVRQASPWPMKSEYNGGYMTATSQAEKWQMTNRADRPLTLIRCEAGSLGSSQPGTVCKPGETIGLGLTPPQLPEGTVVSVQPWLVLSDGTREYYAVGTAYWHNTPNVNMTGSIFPR